MTFFTDAECQTRSISLTIDDYSHPAPADIDFTLTNSNLTAEVIISIYKGNSYIGIFSGGQDTNLLLEFSLGDNEDVNYTIDYIRSVSDGVCRTTKPYWITVGQSTMINSFIVN